MSNKFLPPTLPEIKNFYVEAFEKFNTDTPAPEINVEFYPYVGINQTIRIRDGKVFVRLAELCRDVPPEFQRALAYILTAKLLRRKVPPQAAKVYRDFVKSEDLTRRMTENKKLKGRKVITTAKGEFYDLDEIFLRLNQAYFQNRIPPPTLTWSARKTFRILGHHDAAHETIVISKSFDDRKIPQFVVEFIVFHEMLHIFHPTIYRDGRKFNHTAQFRCDERKFEFYNEAEDWIAHNAAALKRKIKRQSAR